MSASPSNVTNLTGDAFAEDTLLDTGDSHTADPLAIILLEGGLILVVCFIGVICNFLSFLVMIRHRAFRNSFGYLTAYHAISNATILLIFVFWAVPWTILPLPEQLQWINLRVGQLSLFFVETAFHCSLFISINRFVAISFPLRYRQMFTNRTTLAMVTFISVVSGLYWGVYFKEGCDFFFDHEYRIWSFGLEPCSLWLSFHIDMMYNVCLFLVVGIIDVMTLFRLQSLTKNIQTQRKNIDIKKGMDTSRRQRKELLFFVQALANSCIYAFMLICFHLISRVATTNFELFLCTTFIWGFSHTAGGVILVAFNPEIRRNLGVLRNISRSIHDPGTITNIRPSPASTRSTILCRYTFSKRTADTEF